MSLSSAASCIAAKMSAYSSIEAMVAKKANIFFLVLGFQMSKREIANLAEDFDFDGGNKRAKNEEHGDEELRCFSLSANRCIIR